MQLCLPENRFRIISISAPARMQVNSCSINVQHSQVAPSEQKRKPDRNNYVLEISEAGEVKQIPVIQPALDAISGLWTSLAGSDRPAKPVPVVKPTKVVVATVRPSKTKHKATPTTTVGTTRIVPPQSTPRKVASAVRSSSVVNVVTVTPKMIPVTEVPTTTTTTTTTMAIPTTTQTTTTTSTGRALEDGSVKQAIPIEFFLRLQQLLLKIRQYNKEIAIPVFALN
ncbi:hypothetical protein pipiens_002867 [Culex pipiens pipiens]|uniref:Uncharacterized protein n=1 Tax=Culex pipiens pipiens TaxID=38569 RepID=A0ABD1D701_CULPP